MRYDPERYYHVPCNEGHSDIIPLKYAWPDEKAEGLHYIEARTKYLDGDEQFVHCPLCGTIWSTDDPIIKEADQRYWHFVRKKNREHRQELAADPEYRSLFKSEAEMWKHLKKCSIS